MAQKLYTNYGAKKIPNNIPKHKNLTTPPPLILGQNVGEKINIYPGTKRMVIYVAKR